MPNGLFLFDFSGGVLRLFSGGSASDGHLSQKKAVGSRI
jgi:hypothetical protein